MKKSLIFFVFLVGLLLVSFVSAEKVRVVIEYDEQDNKGIVNYHASSVAKEKIIEKNVVNKLGENRLVLEIEREELKELGEEYEIVPRMKTLLDESVGQIKANDSWLEQINGINLTGINQTVCILDTGINYSHPDFGGCNLSEVTSGNCEKIVAAYDFAHDDNDVIDFVGNGGGHGTHVAGIVGANGGIKGVAPEVKLAIGKVFNDTGIGNGDWLLEGLDWCINNVSNVSAISLSIGFVDDEGDEIPYDNYCDADYGPYASWINIAVSRNISVVVSSGNELGAGNISSPACITNATPVGSVRGDDVTISDYNRNSLVNLLAPGWYINSTYLSPNNYASLPGTSMSAPHVAGAIAIINQKLSLLDRSKTPAEIEDLLNDTGFRINDTLGTGIEYSRIDLFAALDAIEEITVSQDSPENETYTKINETNFTCSANSPEFNLTNMTFYLYNSTDLINSSTKDLTGLEDNSTFNYTFSEEGTYTWSCIARNNNSENVSTGNYTIIYDISSENISAVSVSESYNSATLTWSTNESTNFSIVSGTNTTNAEFSVNHSGVISGLTELTLYNYTLTYCDRAGNCNTTEGNFTTTEEPASQSGGSSSSGGGDTPTEETITADDCNSSEEWDAILEECVLIEEEEEEENVTEEPAMGEAIVINQSGENSSSGDRQFKITEEGISESFSNEEQDIKSKIEYLLNKMGVIVVVPWYFFAIPVIVLIVWAFGVWFILHEHKKAMKKQKRIAAGKKAWFTRKWKNMGSSLKGKKKPVNKKTTKKKPAKNGKKKGKHHGRTPKGAKK